MSLLNSHYLSSVNVFLSSDHANYSYSSSHKVFDLKDTLIIPHGSHAMIALTSFVMPYTMYLINDNNNSFKISTYDGATWVEQTITLPNGNYSMGELIPAINTLFTTYSVSLGSIFTLVANYTTNKFYITSSVAMNTVLISDVLCYKILGMEPDTTYTYNDLSTLTMPNVFDFSGNSCIYIRLKHHKIKNLNSANVDGILQRINLEVLPLEYVFYHAIDIQYFEITSRLINRFDIEILDENFKSLELNGGIFRLSFNIHFNYNKQVIMQPLREQIDAYYDNTDETIELNNKNKS
jgi:hypothetical protein